MKIIAATTLWGIVLASGFTAQAAELCKGLANPIINVKITDAQPRFDYSMTQKKMAEYATNASLPAADIYDLTVNAMSTGSMRIDRQVKFRGQRLGDNQVCVQVSEVNVHIHVDPVIYIAKELHDEGCEFKEYYLHEMKHVEEDRKLVEDYKAIIDRNMAFAFPESADYKIGPVPAAQVDQSAQSLRENVEGVLTATFDSMMRERRERQRAIDNTGEYLRLAHVCGENGAGVKPELRTTDGNKK